MKINIFTPPKFDVKPLDLEYLNETTNKKWQYSSSGRASIYQILKFKNIDKILVPVYVCETILIPLRKLNIEPIFYDLQEDDLNASLDSIKELVDKSNIKTVLIASMYGNPANLIEIEKYCKDNDIFLVDDAAQSFGAKLDDRFIGTFGDAGFFSFSPGKPTAGHMGSFFWSSDEIKIDRVNHTITHYFRWLDFKVNRYEIYTEHNKIYKKAINLISRFLLKMIDTFDDNMCKFENDILGGILSNNLNGKFEFRNIYQKKFIEKFKENKYFNTIQSIRGISNNHKLIIKFEDKHIAQRFIKYMFDNSIYVSNGYFLLTDNLDHLPNAKKVSESIVELPIENDENRMNYLFKKVEEFEG